MDVTDGICVCRRSGLAIGNYYGAGSGRIWMDDVYCRGQEMSLVECRHRGWGSHNCGHGEDVSVVCANGQYSSVDIVYLRDVSSGV